MSEIVNVTILNEFLTSCGLGRFGNHNNGIVDFPAMPLPQKLTDTFHLERIFRNQNNIRPAAFAAVESKPAGMASHCFHNKNTAMGTGGCSQPVDFLHDDVNRRVKTERIFGSREIVIDGFRDTHCLDTQFM